MLTISSGTLGKLDFCQKHSFQLNTIAILSGTVSHTHKVELNQYQIPTHTTMPVLLLQ